MAEWNKNKVESSAINGGNEFTTDDVLAVNELNATVNNSFYAVDFVEAMADAPDVSEIDGTGTPSVSLVDNGAFKKFKFSNLKGVAGAGIYYSSASLAVSSGSIPQSSITNASTRLNLNDIIITANGYLYYVTGYITAIGGSSKYNVSLLANQFKGEKGDKGETGDSYVLTNLDKTEIAEETAELVSYVQPNEPENALEGTLWVDTDEESDSVAQNLLCKINDGINVIDTGLTYSRGVVEVRKIGSIIWVIDSGVYNFTDSFSAKSSRTVFEFTLPKSISNCIHNTNGVYGTTGTISYFPALAYENVNYSTFNCQSYLKRSAIGETYDTFQMVYTGVNAISGGGLCGFHSKMPVIMVQQEGGNN